MRDLLDGHTKMSQRLIRLVCFGWSYRTGNANQKLRNVFYGAFARHECAKSWRTTVETT